MSKVSKVNEITEFEGIKYRVVEITDEGFLHLKNVNPPFNSFITDIRADHWPAEDDIQKAFDAWMDKVKPSGDVDDVQHQWIQSEEYLDLFSKGNEE